jgi:integrase
MRQAGSIIKKGRRYYVVYRNPAGKQKWVGGFKKQSEAQAERTRILGEMHVGTYFETIEKTFSEFADEWLENRVSIKGSTWQNYQSYLHLHVKPVLGPVKLTAIDPSMVQNLVTRLSKNKDRPLSGNTIRKVATMLSTLFKAAVKNRLIRVNPAKELELPKRIKPKIQPPNKNDVKAILEKAPLEVRTLFHLEARTGLRRGEILALQRSDIDWLSGELIVERAICKAKATDGVHKYQWVLGPTKGGQTRRVGLSQELLEMLTPRCINNFTFYVMIKLGHGPRECMPPKLERSSPVASPSTETAWLEATANC